MIQWEGTTNKQRSLEGVSEGDVLPSLFELFVLFNILTNIRMVSYETLKGLAHEIFRPLFWPVWIYLGLNWNPFWFLNFKEGSLILDSYFKFWCVSCQTFSDIHRISEKDWPLSLRFSNFSFFWVSSPPRNAAKDVNHSRRFYKSPRMIDNLFRGSSRMFFNNISMSLIQLSIPLGDSTNLREGLVWNASILKITA